MNRKWLGYYNYTVILTYCGLLSAFCGILYVLCENYWNAVFCLMLAGACDMFDGTVAARKARTSSEKNFGIQIDSLSDLVSFGVLPGVFVYMICGRSRFVGFIASAFVLSALIRLAYFNVMEEERQSQTDGKRKFYLGVPVTSIALLLPAVYLLYGYMICRRSACFPILLLLLAIGFLFPVEIRKPDTTGKVVMIAVGILEMLGMLFMLGWKPL